MTDVKIKRALLSVSDKAGLADLGAALARHGVELVSTGGTAKALRDAGITPTVSVALPPPPVSADPRGPPARGSVPHSDRPSADTRSFRPGTI